MKTVKNRRKQRRESMLRTNASGKKLCIRALLLIMLMVLLLGEASATITGAMADRISSKKMNIYVRVFVPGNNTPWKSIGHFDLMIEGKVYYKGKIFKNPVFSYRSEDSCLAVFNEADTGRYYKNSSPTDYYYDCSLYQGCFATVDYTTVQAFLKQLDKNISSAKKYDGGVKCKFKRSSMLSKYRLASTNCFYAVALWLKGFDSDSLMDYYYGAHSGRNRVYLPKNIVREYSEIFKLKYEG